jgi:signal transduction histidine kinase
MKGGGVHGWRPYGRRDRPSSADLLISRLIHLGEDRDPERVYVRPVTRRRLIDIGLPLALAVAATIEVATSTAIDVPWAIAALFALGTTLPLLWRRRAPLVVLVVVMASIVVADATYDIADNAASPFGGLLVAAYATGAYTSRRDGWIGGGLIGAMAIGMAVSNGEDAVGDALFIGGILYAVWGAAMIVRSRQELARALAARTVELEHEREENAKLAVAEERARIARELHDVVAHNLAMMIMQAGGERRVIGSERPQTTAVLETIEDTGRTAMAEMRRLLGMLRSDDELALAPQPSLRYLDDLVAQVRDAGMPVDLRIEGDPRPLAPGIDLSAYRIVQEALTNALKHAGPARARVTVRYGKRELDIEITDDGAGGANGGPGGHGLVGMRERVALFGGNLAAGQRLDGGYAVRARLPLEGVAP